MLPNGWKLTTLEKLGTSDRPPIKAGPFGSSLKKEFYVKSGYKVYGQEQVIAGDLSIGNYYIDSHRFESLKSCAVQPGDVLISLVGTFGKAVVVPNEAEPGIINPRLIRLSLDSSKVDPFFIKEWLVSPTTQNLFNDVAHWGTMGVLNAQTLKSLQLLLPPLPEQKKIAEILSSVDEAIASTQAVIDQIRKVKQGLLQQLLTRGIGHTRFKESAIGKIPESWKVVSLQEMGKPNWFVIRSGPFGSSLKTEHFRLEGEPVLTIQSLGEGEILKDGLFYIDAEKAKELSEYRVQPGDLVFSRVADIGRSVVITEYEKNWLISSNLMRISVNQEKYNPWFLMYSIVGGGPVTRQIEKLSGTTGRPVVSSTMMKQITFAIPPLDEQYAIVMRIQQTEEMIRQEGLAVDRLVALKNGLMQDLLTGKVRVGGTP